MMPHNTPLNTLVCSFLKQEHFFYRAQYNHWNWEINIDILQQFTQQSWIQTAI